MTQYIEQYLPPIQSEGLNTQENVRIEGSLTVLNGIIAAGQEQTEIADTNGTTAVSVFGASGLPYAITITGVFLIALDTTAGNITVEAPASTVVCTIAKGVTAGALVGATTLANTSVPANTNVVVDSSTAGNAKVYISYRRT